jgi:hypothetical protein
MRQYRVSVSLHLSTTASPAHEWYHGIYCSSLLLDCSLIYQPSISETDDKITNVLLCVSWSLGCCTKFIICEICSDCTRCTVHSCQIWVKVEGFFLLTYLDCGQQVPSVRHVNWIRMGRWLQTSNKIFLNWVSDPSRNCVQRRGFALPRMLVLWGSYIKYYGL